MQELIVYFLGKRGQGINICHTSAEVHGNIAEVCVMQLVTGHNIIIDAL